MKPESKLIALTQTIWNYRFKDCRLILEQSGNLKYLYITAGQQRFCFRSLLITLGSFLLVISIAVSYHLYIHLLNADLSHSNSVVNKKKQMALEALAAASDLHPSLVANMSNQELKAHAERMRERDKSIKQLVEFAASDLAQANKTLELALSASGLTKAKIEKLKSEASLQNGRGGLPNPIDLDSSFEGQIVEHIREGQALKGVLDMVPSANPIPGSRISSGYGLRQHPITGRLDLHAGIDFVPGHDGRIIATLPGKVTFAGYRSGYGNTVVMKHAGGVETLFAHLDKIHVKTGMSVKKQQAIGIAGNTGLSTGTHLHYEVRVDGQRINPLTPIVMAQPHH